MRLWKDKIRREIKYLKVKGFKIIKVLLEHEQITTTMIY